MAGPSSFQDALAEVALKLESLKAQAVTQKELDAGKDASQLAAIKRMAQELEEALLEPQPPLERLPVQESTAACGQSGGSGAAQHNGAEIQQQQQQQQQVTTAAAEPGPTVVASQARLPATPFEQRKPAEAPTTAVKSAPTPGGGMPATTPLAAEVLASLNFVGAAAGGSSAAAPLSEQADGTAAAATLRSLDLLPSGATSTQEALFLQMQPSQPAGPTPAALASIFQDAQLMAPPQPVHAAAMAAAAAAAAAGPALPVLRRQSGSALLGGLAAGGSQGREARPCNCKRSMCLKMYCECFAAGGFCAPSCSCLNCSNTPHDMAAVTAAREVVLAKNPRAFEVKVTATEGHKRGCRCKRSKCLKKYCECFHAGARCNPDICQCEDCRNTDADALLMPLLGSSQHAWTATSADVLAMFDQPGAQLAEAASGGSNSSGSGDEGMRIGRRRSRAQARQVPPPTLFDPATSAAFPAFMLPPLPEAAFGAAGPLGPASFPPPNMFASSTAPGMPGFDHASAAAAFMLNPMAAAAAATIAAAATMAEHQQLEESMADAVSCPAASGAVAAAGQPPVPAGMLSGAPAGAALKMTSALTSHLSDVAGPDSDMHDTATSPAPHMAIAKMTAAAPTLTGGAGINLLGRALMPNNHMRSIAAPADSQLSFGSADENAGDSANTSASQRSKRPRRAASGGVLGAVAAEASDWGFDAASPPLKRANSMTAVVCEPSKARGKVSDRVALLKRALAGESAAVQQKQLMGGGGATGGGVAGGVAGATAQQPPLEADAGCAPPTAEDEDAISALFELSSSVC